MEDRNRRIAQNAIALYFRMFVQLLIGLYSSRLILEVLGVDDYGIYNVVGGFVTLFTFMQGALMQATQRFLTFELGRDDTYRLKSVFYMSINIYAIFSIILFILLEVIGLFFLDDFLNIPAGRWNATYWVYQCSIVTLMIQLMSTPYNALIIAHEDIKSFAYIDLLYSILNLLAIIVLKYIPGLDNLIIYAVTVMLISALVRILYTKFCKKHYNEVSYKLIWDKQLFKEMVSFSSWVTLSAVSEMLKKQGITVLLNLLFGVVANAALGIAYQVNGFINRFATNLQTAFIPQLVKSYAEHDLSRTAQLIFSGAKMCCVLLLLFSIPLCIEIEYVIHAWLKNPPTFASILIVLILADTAIKSLTYSMNTAIRATGKIKRYEITLNVIQFISFIVIVLVSYTYSGSTIAVPFIIQIFFSVLVDFYIIYYCSKTIHFSSFQYFRLVCLRVVIMVLVVLPIPLFLRYHMEEGFLRLLVVSVSCLVEMVICLYLFVLSEKELDTLRTYFGRMFKLGKL